MLEIHQISTGRGNAALVLGPDGTSVVIDAGATSTDVRFTCEPRPSDARRPGEWIARYIRRQLARTRGTRIDYLVATHLHPDHVGDVAKAAPRSAHGDYFLTGITDLAEEIEIATLLDRGFPDYAYPKPPVDAAFARNYLAYVRARQSRGERCEQLVPGRADQLVLRQGAKSFPQFSIRTVAAGGRVWTGRGEEAARVVPPLSELAERDYPDENMCSVALALRYGNFDCYTGGDLYAGTADGEQPWRDIATAVARVVGPVEVAVADHHGYFDAVSAEAVRALRPLVWIVPAWHVTHPGMAQLERMSSHRLYPGPREIFITSLTPTAALINQRFLPRISSTDGHVVVRVEPGGERFEVFVMDDRSEAGEVSARFGSYASRPK